MRSALIGAAEFNEADFSRRSFDYVVAVDAGWNACAQAGIAPDCALGDFDSLGFVPQGPSVLAFDAEKDESDMELALRHVRALGADETWLYGALSGRLDHTLANLQLMGAYARLGTKVAGIGTDFALVVMDFDGSLERQGGALRFSAIDPAALEGDYAPFISLFPVGGAVEGLCIEGLKYETSGLCLAPGASRGLSNEFTGRGVRVSADSGVLAAVFPLAALDHAFF